ncbi:chondroitin AC/alginate lyase [Cadophora sp. MPI-SDFR-AT-0126]|nr:chondroitin AC/alginate lyase [Leotiomycetes sp. MPI-SDFR-AT-0126]
MKPSLRTLAVYLGFSRLAVSWVHPGILHNIADLSRIKKLVASKTQPWYEAYQAFAADSNSLLIYSFTGACPVVTPDKNANLIVCMGQFASDSVAALQLAMMWTISGSTSYADKATAILSGWGSTHTDDLPCSPGTDDQLAAALFGSNLVNAAEIIRYTYSGASYSGGWTASSIDTFSTMVNDVLVPPASLTNSTPAVSYLFQANWGTSSEKFMLASAVFLETPHFTTTPKNQFCIPPAPICPVLFLPPARAPRAIAISSIRNLD